MEELPADFKSLLEQSGMVFGMPENFTPVAAKGNDSVLYHHAVAAPPPGKLELRYQLVAPAAPPPGGFKLTAAAEPGAVRQAMLLSVIMNIAARVIAPPSPFPEEAVRGEFAADWGAVCRVELKPSAFAEGFRECMILALHRGGSAAYVFMLYDDFERSGDLLESSFYTLKFAAAPPRADAGS